MRGAIGHGNDEENGSENRCEEGLRHEVVQGQGTRQEEHGQEVADAIGRTKLLDYDETGRRQLHPHAVVPAYCLRGRKSL
jgi:hypothetical protein